jgi:hypothetical protein
MAEAELNRQIVILRARVVDLRAVGTDVAVAEADALDATAVAMDLGVRGLQEAAVVRQQMGRDADAAAVQAAADLRAARALIPMAPVAPAVGAAPLNPQAGAGGGPQQRSYTSIFDKYSCKFIHSYMKNIEAIPLNLSYQMKIHWFTVQLFVIFIVT